nr:MAG TPA: hypothetical protein [Caudoviricetes sp.]
MGTKFNSNSKAKTRCHIIRNDNNRRLNFQFNPTTIPYSRGVSYTSIESPGMSYPLTQYTGGKAREFSFSVYYYDKPFSGKINTARKFLEGLLPPEKNKRSFKKPPTFTLAYGYFVKTLVLTQLEVEDTWMDSNGRPIETKFTLTVRQV